MDQDNNPFLNSYKKKLDERQGGEQTDEPKPGVRPPANLHFEEQSSFVRPSSAGEISLSASRSRSGKKTLVYIAVVLVIAAIIGVIWYNSGNVEVIDLTDWTVNDAQLWAGDHDIKLQITEQYQDTFDEGKIYDQGAEPGSKIRKGSFLKISVSLGHDLSVVLALPDLMNMTKGEIESWAAENYMAKVRMTTEFSDQVEAGAVIRYEINDNTVVDEVKRSTPIYIIISKGKEDTTADLVTVPDFRQMNIPQSQEFAKENGLLLKIVETYDDYAAEGSIFAQSVKVDEEVAVGTSITLSVSMGKKIILPSFAGYSKERAQAVAGQLGITATITEKYSAQPLGDFLSQSVEAGTIWKSGSYLELTYSLGNEVVLPSFVGQTQAAIETWAMDLNKQGAAITIKAGHTQSNMPKDSIIYQNKSNTVIDIESTIRITVSLGRMIFAPDFVAPEGSGYDQAITREKALQICSELGIIPIFVEENKSGRLPGEIWSQSIAAGKEIYEGTTITLKFRSADVTVNVPRFVGMTRSEIIASGYLKKFNIVFVMTGDPDVAQADFVVDQSLTPGTTVVSGSTITLSVNPPAPEVNESSETTQMSETEATTSLTKASEETTSVTSSSDATSGETSASETNAG